MEALVVLGVITLVFALFDVLALRFGVDSRNGSPDPRAQLRPTGITV